MKDYEKFFRFQKLEDFFNSLEENVKTFETTKDSKKFMEFLRGKLFQRVG